jgi:hypothetical protein
MKLKRSFETKLGLWMGAWMAVILAMVALHWWQDSMDEDARWITSCHTMGNRLCGPDSGPLGITINIGGTRDDR